MNDILELDFSWEFCPTCWQNFITHLQKKHRVGDHAVPTHVIDKELIAYGGIYLSSSTRGVYALFDSPEYKTVFMLKFA